MFGAHVFNYVLSASCFDEAVSQASNDNAMADSITVCKSY